MDSYTKHIGLYDVKKNDIVIVDGKTIKSKGQNPPTKDFHFHNFEIYFAQDFSAVAHDLERLDTAFINADDLKSRKNGIDLVGVGYRRRIHIEINGETTPNAEHAIA